MTEILLALITSPEFRSLVEEITMKIVADVFHRRSVDPDYLAKSDLAFANLYNAKTSEEKTSAQIAVQSLISGTQ